MWSIGELSVGLTRLKTPGHRGEAADHLVRLEGASKGPCGAVLHDQL